jgi:SagB-type dehydrogenase family enzyme
VLLRRSRAVVVTFSGVVPLVHNFITRHSAWCHGFGFDLLCQADQWIEAQDLLAKWPGVDAQFASQWLRYLLNNGFLVVAGSAAAAIDVEYESFWRWGPIAGFYHFALKDPPYMTAPQARQWMEYRGASERSVPLYTTNRGFAVTVDLPEPDMSSPGAHKGLLSILARRRSVRSFVREEISREALRDCLFAGLGLTGFLDTKIEGSRALPLKMTPSGGGRNPYEGYVYALRVHGVPPGLYHYSAAENSLGLVSESPHTSLSELLVGQHWAEDCSAVVLLVANFERTMWKYPNATAYRVVVMEAGHIAQNISVAAASHGLSTTPTAAFSDACAHRLMSLDWLKQSLVYAILVGKGDPQAFEYRNFTPHRPKTP